MPTPHPGDPPLRHANAIAVGLIGLTLGCVVLVGLPLYGDGAWYFVKLVMDGAPLVPNLRVGAVPAQLPVLVGLRLTDDPLVLRHAFAFGYAGLPWLSLVVCALLVGRRAPGLLLFPLLSLAGLQLNFSAVSELLLSLHLCWPFVLAALLVPDQPATRAIGWLLAPWLVLLHPLAFGAAGALALLALGVGWWGGHPVRRHWWRLATWFAVAALLRLVWTALGSNPYERENLVGDAAVRYLLPEGPLQLWWLALIALVGLLASLSAWWQPARRLTTTLGWALPLLALVIGAGFLNGEGIRLKVALTWPLGLGLMALAVLAWWGGRPGRPRQGTPGGVGLIAAVTAAILILALARAGAWWTATHQLRNLTAASPASCIRWGPETPYDLQWPWMAIIDNWAVPLNALVFRGDPALGPAALLLSGDGCARLGSGWVHFNGWIEWPFPDVDARFGPLRGVSPP